MKYDLISEDWRKDYEKIILSRKYSRASTSIGVCSSMPTIENVKTAYGYIMDFVTFIPIPSQEKLISQRKTFIDDLDKIGLVLFGKDCKEKRDLMKKYGVTVNSTRRGVRIVPSLQNLPNLIKALRDILLSAGEFATSAGLRIGLATPRKFGKERILEEEGFKDLEI